MDETDSKPPASGIRWGDEERGRAARSRQIRRSHSAGSLSIRRARDISADPANALPVAYRTVYAIVVQK
jgi:hypothetical protein